MNIQTHPPDFSKNQVRGLCVGGVSIQSGGLPNTPKKEYSNNITGGPKNNTFFRNYWILLFLGPPLKISFFAQKKCYSSQMTNFLILLFLDPVFLRTLPVNQNYIVTLFIVRISSLVENEYLGSFFSILTPRWYQLISGAGRASTIQWNENCVFLFDVKFLSPPKYSFYKFCLFFFLGFYRIF